MTFRVPAPIREIAVDTSALMAIILDEERGEECFDVLKNADTAHISAATVAESLIVAAGKGVLEEFTTLFDRFGLIVEAPTALTARRVAAAYARFGKGNHPAGLTFGDCFSYVVATELNIPLLYVGRDFARTDVVPALRQQAA